jgi:2-hydroxy-6-oxonona-2,4-dienedioate hydrolase
MRVTRLALSFGISAVAAASVGAAFATDLRAAQARLAGRSRVVPTASGPIEVAEVGEGQPALVVHGAAGGFDMGLQIGTDVLGEGFRVIAPSRFGYLGTPMPVHASHDDQADVLADLLDALDVPSAAVLAVSAGAQSATRLALRHPERVRALVLVTPALYLPPPPGARDVGPPDFVMDHLLASDLLVWAVSRLAPGLVVKVAGVPPALSGWVTAEDRERFIGWFFPAKARHVGLAHDMRTTTPTAPDLPIEELRMPVLLVSAEDDPYLTAEVVRYSARRLPAARVLVCEAGGHVLLGQDDRVADEVRSFLAG